MDSYAQLKNNLRPEVLATTAHPAPEPLVQYIAYATMTPVPGRAMYCLPPTMYVIGVAEALCAALTFHTALPVFASSASRPPPPPTNSRPPAVDSTPDRPAGAGKSHTFFPVNGFIARM